MTKKGVVKGRSIPAGEMRETESCGTKQERFKGNQVEWGKGGASSEKKNCLRMRRTLRKKQFFEKTKPSRKKNVGSS